VSKPVGRYVPEVTAASSGSPVGAASLKVSVMPVIPFAPPTLHIRTTATPAGPTSSAPTSSEKV
jgi:hypothetical protein